MKVETFTQKAQAEAASRKWSMKRLSREAGVTYDVVREMYRRGSTPQLESARKIGAALGFSVDSLEDDTALSEEREILEYYRALKAPSLREKARSEMRFLRQLQNEEKKSDEDGSSG